MTQLDRYFRFAKISEAKFRRLLRRFALESDGDADGCDDRGCRFVRCMIFFSGWEENRQ
jgi:hypothetical protein